MARTFLLSIGFLITFISTPANAFTLTGKATDVNNAPIEFGNAIVLSSKDSTIIKGAVFMSGHFKITGLTENSFILKITAVGYYDQFLLLESAARDSLLDAGTIQLKSNTTLKEVEITSKLPLFERDGEKVKVNVENSALSSSGSVMDILKKSPTVMVSSSDAVSIFGKGNAVIYVDGQQLASPEVLKTISSTEVKEIEIIANPSAKYDAAGKAVINIITKKNNLEGYNGNLIQNTLYGNGGLFTYSGLRFNWKKKKWSTYLSYGYPHGKSWNVDEYYRNVKSNDSTTTEMRNKLTTISDQTNAHNYRAGATYYIDTSKSVSLQYNGFHNVNRNTIDNINDIEKNGIPEASIKTYTVQKPVMQNNSASVNFTKKLDTLQSEYSATIQYGNFASKGLDDITQDITTNITTPQQIKRSTGSNDIQIFTFQTDLNKSFSKTWKLESGIKDSYINNKSKTNFETMSPTGEWITDSAYFNGYSYNENIFAGYAQFRFTKKKLTLRAGGRGEYTSMEGTSAISGKQLVSRNYFSIFPSAYFGYEFTKDLKTGITYSSRISRPSFQDMDPFVNYIDSLSSFRGNPNLQPSYTHEAEVELIYMEEASLSLSYERTNGAINLVVDKLNDGSDAFVATNKNLDYSETYSAGITIPYELSWWTTYNYFGYLVNTFSYKSSGSVINNTKPMFYMYLYDEFRIKKLFSAEVTFEYTSAGVDGIFTFEPFYNLSANIKKTFFNDKLTCRFIASDILSTAYNRGASNVKGYDVEYVSRENTHYFVLAINYKFGKLKANDYRDKTVNNEEYERIKMGK